MANSPRELSLGSFTRRVAVFDSPAAFRLTPNKVSEMALPAVSNFEKFVEALVPSACGLGGVLATRHS
jgi:hypothetical protein